MGKLKYDKQRAKHLYPVLEMLNNKIKGLKLKKISLKIWRKKSGKLTLTGESPRFQVTLPYPACSKVLTIVFVFTQCLVGGFFLL